MRLHTVQAVIRGVGSADENLPARVSEEIGNTGALDPAVVHYPQDREVAVVAQWAGDSVREVKTVVAAALQQYGSSVEFIGVEELDETA